MAQLHNIARYAAATQAILNTKFGATRQIPIAFWANRRHQ